MYIVGGKARDPDSLEVWKYDLCIIIIYQTLWLIILAPSSESIWTKCQKCEIKSVDGAPSK